jgi:hypothetical protein
MLLLALVGVEPDDIASDYELSYERMGPFYSERGEQDRGPALQEFLANMGTSARETILSTLASVDVEGCLRAGGLAADDEAALRRRLVEP